MKLFFILLQPSEINGAGRVNLENTHENILHIYLVLRLINWNWKLLAGNFTNSKSVWCDDQIFDEQQSKNQDGLPTWDSSNCFVVNWLTSSSVIDVPTHPTISSISATCLWCQKMWYKKTNSVLDINLPWCYTQHEKYPYSEFFWSIFSRVRTEYEDIRKNADQKNYEYGHFSRSDMFMQK